MCTAVSYKTKDFYFGRTLDYDFSYGEHIVIMPRKYPISFRHGGGLDEHYVVMGIAHVVEDYPLFYDAVNEKGLAMAGLNFVGNAVYGKEMRDKDNVAQFEFLSWILCSCASVGEAKAKLQTLNITDAAYSDILPAAQLHWMIADAHASIVVECTEKGMDVYENPVGVLTNNPEFPMQTFALNNYMHLSAKDPKNTLFDMLPLCVYSRGMGALGLPGDLSSQSRFVRAAFTKMNSKSSEDEHASVSQFFHILGAVSQTRGCCVLPDGKEEITLYTTCYNCSKGLLYYTCYDKQQISALSMHHEDLNSKKLIVHPMLTKDEIPFEN